MKSLTKKISLCMVFAVGFASVAQENLREELNDEISVLYPKTTLKKKPAKKVAFRQDIDENPRNVIINNNVSAPAPEEKIQEQPVSTVEATPVEPSKGLESRKTREKIEKGTEDTIVQQLEKDRLEAEKERAKRAQDLFVKENPPQVAPVAPVAVQEVAPAPVVAPIVAPTQTVKAEVEQTQSSIEEKTSVFAGLMAGIGDYATANNVEGKAALGVTFGVEFPENFIIEGHIIHSEYDVTNTQCYNFDFYGNCINSSFVGITQRMTQWNIGVAGKYALLTGRVRPVVGGILSYTKRSFENKYNPQNYNYYYNTRQTYPETWAIDGGLLMGVDVKLSNRMHLGADIRYMTNLTYDRNDSPQTRNYNNTQPIEELSYYIFSAQATFSF